MGIKFVMEYQPPSHGAVSLTDTQMRTGWAE